MALEFKLGLIMLATQVNGVKTALMAKAHLNMSMVMCMMAIGPMIKPMVMVFTST